MSATKHRRAGGFSDELTEDERLALSHRGLASEVTAACNAWLMARGIGPGKLFTYPTLQPAGDRLQAQHGGNDPGGGSKV